MYIEHWGSRPQGSIQNLTHSWSSWSSETTQSTQSSISSLPAFLSMLKIEAWSVSYIVSVFGSL